MLRDFTTFCHECHEIYHPDKLAEFLQAGWTLERQDIFERLGISSVHGKDQLKPYKEYLKLVHFFLELFDTRGIPKKPQTVLRLAKTSLPDNFRAEAVHQAIKDMKEPPVLFGREKKMLKKMTEAEKEAFLTEQQRQFVRYRLKSYLEPSVDLVKDRDPRSVRI
jgi:hypothetical protein